MKDEEFMFRSDCKEKSITARSARNKRTHCGKGGSVKLPSDNLSRKELQAMNGEMKSYRLNQPMKWDEFKAMPDDIKVIYIKLLREKFDVPDIEIGRMMGADKDKISRLFKKLCLRSDSKRRRHKYDSDGWLAFVNGTPVQKSDPVQETQETEQKIASLEDICEHEPVPVTVPAVNILPVREEKEKAIPCSGNMTFVGSAEAALNSVGAILCGADVHITITWEVCD